jgi:hypothetical protein
MANSASERASAGLTERMAQGYLATASAKN